jgi:hypothetical protein
VRAGRRRHLRCWGSDIIGQLGDGAPNADISAPAWPWGCLRSPRPAARTSPWPRSPRPRAPRSRTPS